MNNDVILPICVEKFAAYLDNNLPDDEMNQIDGMISNTPGLEELVAVSDCIDQDVQEYLSDDFLYEADTAIFEEDSFEIPLIDTLVTAEQQNCPAIENCIEEQDGVLDGGLHNIEVKTEISGNNELQNIEVQIPEDEIVIERTSQEEDNIFEDNADVLLHNGGDNSLLIDN